MLSVSWNICLDVSRFFLGWYLYVDSISFESCFQNKKLLPWKISEPNKISINPASEIISHIFCTLYLYKTPTHPVENKVNLRTGGGKQNLQTNAAEYISRPLFQGGTGLLCLVCWLCILWITLSPELVFGIILLSSLMKHSLYPKR
jgi:hypothetical protein